MSGLFIRDKKIKTVVLPEDCPSCGAKNSLVAATSQNYFSFLFIPVFPIFKLTGCECTQCKKAFKADELLPASQTAIDQLRNNVKTPLWSYTGAILFVAIIVAAVIAVSANKKKNKKLMANPQKGDLLEIELGEDNFTFYRIDSVSTDSAYLRSANQTATNLFLLSELKPKGDTLFTGDIFALHRNKLIQMVEESVIMGVDRN